MLTVQSCFFDMANKMSKIRNLFWNTSDENVPFEVVKLMDRWIVDALKGDKNDKALLCDDIAQIIDNKLNLWYFKKANF